MSTIRTEVVTLSDVRPHPNADALDLGTVKGWQMVLKKGIYKSGDKAVYFEAGSQMPAALAERLGVANFLQHRSNIDGERVLVVGQVKLRGEPSFGLIVPLEDPDVAVGTDLAATYGVVKFRPPVKTTAGDADSDDPRFPAYTDVENMRSFVDVLVPGEPVEATEKLHGTNCRVGFVREESGDVRYMAGSRALRRKDPGEDLREHNTYWRPLTLAPVAALLGALADSGATQAVLYGEVFGRGVQSYDYGTGARQFRAFDLMVDGKYVDRAVFRERCAAHGVETVPVIWEGPYGVDAIRAVADGPSLVGGKHGREGVVVRPLVERTDPRIGRVVLKWIADSYLFGKGNAEADTTDV